MKRKILQIIANYIVQVCEHAYSESMFEYYYKIGCSINAYAIEFHGIYLD
jgi:hypothetical protein